MRDPRRRAAATTWGPLLLLLAVTIVVPAIIFDQFRRADEDRRVLLQKSIAQQGVIVARSLAPWFDRPVDEVLPELAIEVARIDPSVARIRIFVRPASGDADGFFYVATNGRLKSWQMDKERRDILALGALETLDDSCAEGRPLTIEYQPEDGTPELITSITPHGAENACWAVMVSHPIAAYGATAVSSTWDSPQVHAALALYVTMVVATTALVLSVLFGVRRLTRAARGLREGGELGSFDDRPAVPQIAEMAREMDRLVAALRRSADDLKLAAEDNAHALKTPVATLRHATEALRGEVESERGRETLDLLDRSIDRLSQIVQSIRRLDVAAAESLAPDRGTVDLSGMLRAMGEDFDRTSSATGVTVRTEISDRLRVPGDVDMLETVFENLLENALSFAPPGSELRLSGHRTGSTGSRVVVTVEDAGPGVAHDMLERIFDRHVSIRPDRDTGGESVHFGIGLWIARRYVTAHDGTIVARNREGGGLAVTVTLPSLPGTFSG